ncbi:MAG TPA: hypothetical protein PLQ97_02815 [Myxococcota bacterium]|nr:hypothetical protein [Myxococcota bacterium]HQK50761.1 hypothetical protein [Myxococcota bacterium]
MTLLGGYADDFSGRDPLAHPTLLQPDPPHRPASAEEAWWWLRESSPGMQMSLELRGPTHHRQPAIGTRPRWPIWLALATGLAGIGAGMLIRALWQ